MEFGIFNLMGARETEKSAAQVFAEVAEQTRLADELGYHTAWFAEHHFSNYCLCASPLMMVAHCASITNNIRLGTAVLVLPLYNPARLAAEIATADALSNGRLSLGIGAGYQPYEFERFGVDLKQNLEMTEEFAEILDLALNRDFFSYNGKHYRLPETHIPGPHGAAAPADLCRRAYPGDVSLGGAPGLSRPVLGPGRRRRAVGRAIRRHRRGVRG